VRSEVGRERGKWEEEVGRRKWEVSFLNYKDNGQVRLRVPYWALRI